MSTKNFTVKTPEDIKLLAFLKYLIELKENAKKKYTQQEISKILKATEASISFLCSVAKNEIHSRKTIESISYQSIQKDIYTKFETDYNNYNESITPEALQYYIYYYHSYEGIIKPALMKIACSDIEWSNKTGELIYYKKKEDKTNPISYKLTRVFYNDANIELNPRIAYFRAKRTGKEEINFFTITVKNKSLNERFVMFLNYSVVETYDDLKPVVGRGLLVKQNNEADAITKIESIINNQAHVEAWIENILFNKRLEFTEFEYNVFKENEIKIINNYLDENCKLFIEHKQYKHCLSKQEYYIGFFIKSDPTVLVKAIMEIKSNGVVNIYYSAENSTPNKYAPRYIGNVFFPLNHSTQFNCTLYYCSSNEHVEKELNQYSLFIDCGTKSNNLEGVFTRCTRDGLYPIYASSVFFEVIKDKEKTLNELIDIHNPREIQNNNIINADIDFTKIESIFKDLDKKYISTFNSFSKLE